MMMERCVLIRCGELVLDGQPSVTLPSGGKIHFECLIDWRRQGGALSPSRRSADTIIVSRDIQNTGRVDGMHDYGDEG